MAPLRAISGSEWRLEIVDFAEADFIIKAIRYQVFQLEQGIDSGLDLDGRDPTATHVIAYCQDQPVGVARIRYLPEGESIVTAAKIERVAVLVDYRRRGIGTALLQTLLDFLQQQGIPEAMLHAQVASQAFYQRLGFEPGGEVFEEASLPHVKMRQRLQP